MRYGATRVTVIGSAIELSGVRVERNDISDNDAGQLILWHIFPDYPYRAPPPNSVCCMAESPDIRRRERAGQRICR
jgi:hypothetical protein